MLSTGYVTNAMAMPICKYEILSGGATGAPLKYAKVSAIKRDLMRIL